ncbi:ferredoxin reductase [Lysobacter sp. MMG2]|uniref:ferredoxin reductase n=1 Tax=Lysobacter sp. MMG2 TaxID=2801338 RepID=UPI001C233568|nr:ferredoxin reductase [Lysobacter sp. MMG2]MBU8977138.1 ferredoxin reductase [Lysobacter sp. MMG2]
MSAVVRPPKRPRGLRRLLNACVAPSVFDFWASRLDRTWTWDRPLARIVERRVESRDAVTLVLKPNRHWRGFHAGQHLNISVEIDGVAVTRSYSLSDAPRDDGRVAITVKRIEGGKLSVHLFERAGVGDVLRVGPAFGEMTWPQANEAGWLFLAAGSGITPLMSLVREHARRGMPAPLTLLYWARTRDELCFADELLALADAHPDFAVHCILTRESDTDGAPTGRLDVAQLASLVPDAEQRHVYACGPRGFVETARAVTGTQARSFHAEAFTPPQVSLEDTGEALITLKRSGRTLTVPRGQPLLTALEAQGLKPASGCRMGICNTCACGKSAGVTRDLNTGKVGTEPVSALRLCINAAAGDLELDL